MIPEAIKDPERWLWAMVILAVTMWASTDPWFSWVWFLVIAAGLAISFFIGYSVGNYQGQLKGHARGYKTAWDASKRSRW